MVQRFSKQGFTLIELLIAISISLLIGAAAVELFLSSSHSAQIILDQLGGQQEARTIITHFSSELRVASVSSVGAYPLEKASSTEIIFYSNLDADSLRERVRYFVATSTLKKGVTKPSGNPPQYVTSTEIITEEAHDLAVTSTPVFYYFDDAYTGGQTALMAPIDITKVRMVKMRLTIDRDAKVSPVPLVVEGLAQIRNVKNN